MMLVKVGEMKQARTSDHALWYGLRQATTGCTIDRGTGCATDSSCAIIMWFIRRGEVVEWFKAAVLKTAVVVRLPWVRIPPSPPKIYDEKASWSIGKPLALSRGRFLWCLGAVLLREAVISCHQRDYGADRHKCTLILC